jgi:hypothetical protein
MMDDGKWLKQFFVPLCAFALRKARSSYRFVHLPCAKHVLRTALCICLAQSKVFVPLCIVIRVSSKGHTELTIRVSGAKYHKIYQNSKKKLKQKPEKQMFWGRKIKCWG